MKPPPPYAAVVTTEKPTELEQRMVRLEAGLVEIRRLLEELKAKLKAQR